MNAREAKAHAQKLAAIWLTMVRDGVAPPSASEGRTFRYKLAGVRLSPEDADRVHEALDELARQLYDKGATTMERAARRASQKTASAPAREPAAAEGGSSR